MSTSDGGPIDISTMISVDDTMAIRANVEHPEEVAELAARARSYLESMPWCKRVVAGWVDSSWGYILGVFYFKLVPADSGAPEYVWIIVGDIPPAYLDVDCCRTGKDAVGGYLAEMEEWVNRVLCGKPMDESVIPVNVPPTRKWARELQGRLDLLRRFILE